MTDPREHKDKWMLRSKVQPRLRAKDSIIEGARAQLVSLEEEVKKLTELLEASGKDNEVLRAEVKAGKRAHLRMEYRAHKAEGESEGYEQTFDLIQAAQERAIAAWRTATGAKLVLPDWKKLTEWLLNCIIKHEQAFADLNAQWSEQHDRGILLRREEAIRRDKAIRRADEAERKLVALKEAIKHLTRKALNE